MRHSKVILLHPPCTLRDPLTDILTESIKGINESGVQLKEKKVRVGEIS